MSNQLSSSGMDKLLDIISTHQKGVGGGKGGAGDDFLQTLTNAAQGTGQDINSFVQNYLQPKSRVKETPQTPTHTKTNGQVSQAVEGYLQSSTGPVTQMGVVDPNAQPGKQIGQALSAPIDPSADALSMGASGIHAALPFLAAGVKDASEGQSMLDKILNRGQTTNIPPSPVRISLPASVYGAGHEKAVQTTVDNIVPGATAVEKYANLEPTMGRLGDQINQIMQNNPQSTSLDQLLGDFDKNLQDNGIYRTAENAKDTVQKTAQGYINDLTNAAGGNGEKLNPSNITDTALQKMKQSVNKDSQSVFKKIQNGTSLTDKDNVILQARQTVDDALTSLHPEIKNLTTMQSHLYDAADSLYKGKEQELKTGSQGANAGNPILNSILGAGKTLYKDFLGGPGHVVGTTLAGAGALTLNNLYHQSQVLAHSTPVNVKNASISPTTSLAVNGQQLSQSDVSNYLSASAQLTAENAQIDARVKAGFIGAQAAQAQIQQNQAQFDRQYGTLGPVITANGNYQNVAKQIQQVEGAIPSAGLNFLGVLSNIPYINNYLESKSQSTPYGKYYNAVNTLKTLADKAGISIDTSTLLGATSPNAANQQLDSISSSIQQQYNQFKQNNGITDAGQSAPAAPITGKTAIQAAAAGTPLAQTPTATPAPSVSPQPQPTTGSVFSPYTPNVPAVGSFLPHP